ERPIGHGFGRPARLPGDRAALREVVQVLGPFDEIAVGLPEVLRALVRVPDHEFERDRHCLCLMTMIGERTQVMRPSASTYPTSWTRSFFATIDWSKSGVGAGGF